MESLDPKAQEYSGTNIYPIYGPGPHFSGIARLDKRTKNLVKILGPSDIAIVDHADLDKISAEALAGSRVQVVINASRSITGRYPNLGPLLLCLKGVHLVDNVGQQIFEKVRDGDTLTVRGGVVFRGGEIVARGEVLSERQVKESMERAQDGLGRELEKFASNTLEFIKQEGDFFFKQVELPEVRTRFEGKHALVVVRGYDYLADLKVLKPYIRDMKPVLIGVDGGADALIGEGYQPDIIIGDMDSVSDEALASQAELVVHGYPDGNAPGLERLENLGLEAVTFKAPGTSEDIAMMLAHEKEAELIVAVGTHANLVEFLDKGREGMASTFLVRLRVGSRLVDAKGVSKLYRSTVKLSYLLIMLAAALITVLVIVLVSPTIKSLIGLAVWNLRLWLGI
jgi:uncharacterized membrane-anchored protein